MSDTKRDSDHYSMDETAVGYGARAAHLSGEKYASDYERGTTPTSLSTRRGNLSEYYDPNLDPNDTGEEDDSPYPEVRAAVANTDDVTMPAGTVRAWILGLFMAILIPGANQFFYFLYPSVSIGQLIALLIAFPIGKGMHYITPRWRIFGLELNPGPFNIKEHVIVTVMAGIGAYSAYATDIVAVQRVYYNQNWNFSYQWMIVMSTQLIGFSLGGILKRFLVDAPSMIWPANLVTCALFNTLHSTSYKANTGGGMSREKFFLIILAGSFFWYFLPGYLFTALSYFSWVCWIFPNNVKVNQMFGYLSGMGMSVITLDWAQITYIGSPLVTPWWAEANIAFGFFFFYWFLSPILYYSNVWYSQYLPILARHEYDNTGAQYDVFRVLTPEMTFNQTAYEEYSPLFIPTTFAMSYGLSFAAITSAIVHTALYYRKQLYNQARRSMHEQPDIHARLMSQYRGVPAWWYCVIFVIMFVFGCAAIQAFPTGLPIWAFILAILISAVYAIPVGMIQAITNQQVGLNVITELIVGYMLPGRPIAMMLFKTWGYITMFQALNFGSDLKLGHYMKIPPRTMFMCQVAAAMVAGTTQLGVQSWMFTNIEGMCTPLPMFICPSTPVFGAASVIWGVVGPQRMFSFGQVYSGLTAFFLVGALSPIIPYVMLRRYPNSLWKYLNMPIIFNGAGYIPPATAVNYVPWIITGWFFQWFMRRRHFSWWSKYNYTLSAGLDLGVACGAVFIFFTLQFPRGGTIGADTVQTWWGNTVWYSNLDATGNPLKTVAPGEIFGPSTW